MQEYKLVIKCTNYEYKAKLLVNDAGVISCESDSVVLPQRLETSVQQLLDSLNAFISNYGGLDKLEVKPNI